MPRKSLYRYMAVVAIFIVISFSYGYLNTLFTLKKPHAYTKPIDDQGEIVVQLPEIRSTSETVVRYNTYYTDCDHITISEEVLDQSLVGLTKEEYISLVEDWRVTSFTPEEIILERQRVGVCEEHYYVGIQNGYVTLFQGAPGINSTIVEQTEIVADKLRGEDRALLEKGLVIADKEEYLQIREGLAN